MQKLCPQFIVFQIYINDIIFGTTNNEHFYEEFSKMIQVEFEMSMVGELKFFLGLQIKQIDNDIYIFLKKYVKELMKKFKLDNAKEMKTSMHSTSILGLYENKRKWITLNIEEQ